MKFLPDTNVCITLLRQVHLPLVARWRATKVSDILLCSVVGQLCLAVLDKDV